MTTGGFDPNAYGQDPNAIGQGGQPFYPPPPPPPANPYGQPIGYPPPPPANPYGATTYGVPGYPPAPQGSWGGQPGGLGIRFGARVIDGILVAIISFVLGMFVDADSRIMVTGLFSTSRS